MQEDRSQPRRATCKFKRKDEQMQKRKKLAVIGTLLIVLVAGGIVWQVVDVNRTGRSPVSALFKNPLPHRQHLLRLQRRRRHLLLHRQNRQKPEVLPVFRLKVGHRVRKQAIKTLLKNPKQRQNQRQRSRLRLDRRSLRQRRNPLPSRRCKVSHLIHTASIFCPETAGASTLPQHLVIFIACVQQLRCCLSLRFRYFRRHHHGRKHRLGHRHRV